MRTPKKWTGERRFKWWPTDQHAKTREDGDSVQGRWRINAALNNPQVAVKGQSEP